MEGPSDGDRLSVVVFRKANTGNFLARPIDNPHYDGKNIHVRDVSVGEVVRIEVNHTSPVHVIGDVIARFEETVEDPENADIEIVDDLNEGIEKQRKSERVYIPRRYDFEKDYEEQVSKTRNQMPDRV